MRALSGAKRRHFYQNEPLFPSTPLNLTTVSEVSEKTGLLRFLPAFLAVILSATCGKPCFDTCLMIQRYDSKWSELVSFSHPSDSHLEDFLRAGRVGWVKEQRDQGPEALSFLPLPGCFSGHA